MRRAQVVAILAASGAAIGAVWGSNVLSKSNDESSDRSGEFFTLVGPEERSLRDSASITVRIPSGAAGDPVAIAEELNAPIAFSIDYRREAVLLRVSRVGGARASSAPQSDQVAGVGVDIVREVRLASPLRARALVNSGSSDGGGAPSVVLRSVRADWNRLLAGRDRLAAYLKKVPGA